MIQCPLTERFSCLVSGQRRLWDTERFVHGPDGACYHPFGVCFSLFPLLSFLRLSFQVKLDLEYLNK